MAVTHTLDDLARKTGLRKRTIRSYIAFGLLRGPESIGRNAQYSQDHADRLRAIRYLKEVEGCSLEEIRRRLLTLGEEEIRSLGRRGPAGGRKDALVPGSSSALEYLREIGAARSPQRDDAKAGPPADGNLTPVDQLLQTLERLSRGRDVPRRAQGAAWFRIRVTPDIEISVRGLQRADQLARLERIADHLREILLGGMDDE